MDGPVKRQGTIEWTRQDRPNHYLLINSCQSTIKNPNYTMPWFFFISVQ